MEKQPPHCSSNVQLQDRVVFWNREWRNRGFLASSLNLSQLLIQRRILSRTPSNVSTHDLTKTGRHDRVEKLVIEAPYNTPKTK